MCVCIILVCVCAFLSSAYFSCRFYLSNANATPLFPLMMEMFFSLNENWLRQRTVTAPQMIHKIPWCKWKWFANANDARNKPQSKGQSTRSTSLACLVIHAWNMGFHECPIVNTVKWTATHTDRYFRIHLYYSIVCDSFRFRYSALAFFDTSSNMYTDSDSQRIWQFFCLNERVKGMRIFICMGCI